MWLYEFTLIQKIVVAAVPVLFAVVLHEIAHGWTARSCGDNTAWQEGRLSLNPFKHIDPIGTVLVPILLLVTVGFAFGWAKPVPINWNNLRRPRRDMVLVAVAGPLANLCMAIFWALIYKLTTLLSGDIALVMTQMSIIGLLVNVVLMVFNLLPLPPLDGGRIATSLLPYPWNAYLARVEPFGFFIILALLATNSLSAIISPAIRTIMNIILSVFI